jgi:hypothetical protein
MMLLLKNQNVHCATVAVGPSLRQQKTGECKAMFGMA